MRLQRVIDGDTLLLDDGRHLRLIGVNAPELRRGGRPEEPGAQRAADFVRQFLDRPALRIATEREAHDRYGRLLAHVYREDGASLQSALLAAGLARSIAIPPNLGAVDCLCRIEADSRRRGAGLWSSSAYRPVAAASLDAADPGFTVVLGQVSGVSRSRSSWWVEIDDRLSLRIARADQRYFDWNELIALRGREIEARGWLVRRNRRGSGQIDRYPPWMINLRHPASLRVSDEPRDACRVIGR